MIFEKKMVILTGEGGAKGTIRSIRRGGGLKATYALYGVAGDRFGLIVLSGDERYEYPLGGKSGEIILDSDIDVGSAHFIVSDLSRALMYGTLSSRRKPAASLPYKLGEKEKKYEAQTDFDEAQTDFEYSTRQTRLTDIFPSPERYADDAIAEVNFYSGNIESPKNVDTYTQNRDGVVAKSPEDRTETDPENAPFGKVRGIRVAYLGKSFSDLTRSFIEQRAAEGAARETNAEKEKTDEIPPVRGNALRARMESEESDIPAPTVPPDGRETTFYEQMKESIEKLFATGERETRLEDAMPFTRWVRVDYSDNGKYYVVGLIGDKPDYICYGLPAKYTPDPPEETDGKCGWLPLDPARPEGDGFWLMYQSAETGESVEGVAY